MIYDLSIYMEKTALINLNKIFLAASSDSLSLFEIYQAVGLDLSNPIKNRAWIGNRLAAFKKYRLAEPIYELKNNSPVLTHIKLTPKGKIALSQMNQIRNTLTNAEYIKMSFGEIMEEITKLSKKHPNLRIEYSLKDEVISVQYVQK